MPETEKRPASSPDTPAAEATREELLLRLDEAEARSLDYWLQAVTSSVAGASTVEELKGTLSWRITRPLRAVRIVYGQARRSGVREAVKVVRVRLAQIRQARKRG
jgi:hypothetical protein